MCTGKVLVYVCVPVYLSMLVSVSSFVTVWAITFEVVYMKFHFDFDVNFYQVLAQQTQRHTDTHRHTLIHNKLITHLHAQF